MKPRPSPISCNSYFVSELKLSANNRYDPEQPSNLTLDDLEVENAIAPMGEDNAWLIVVSVEQKGAAAKNAPYDFAITVMGYFDIVEGVTQQRADQLLLINGSGILYGAAREILRDVTSKGPYQQLLLPTISFFPLPKKKGVSEVAETAAE